MNKFIMTNIKKKLLLKISAALFYVFTVSHMALTAWFFVDGNRLFGADSNLGKYFFLAFLIFQTMSIVAGALVNGIANRFGKGIYDTKDKVVLIVCTVLGVVSPASLVLNLLCCISKTEFLYSSASGEQKEQKEQKEQEEAEEAEKHAEKPINPKVYNIQKKKLLKVSAVLLYIFTGLYALISAWCFARDQKIYWMFFVFLFVSLVAGILVSAIADKLSEGVYGKKEKIQFLVYTVISVISPASLVINLICYLSKKTEFAETPAKAEEDEKEVETDFAQGEKPKKKTAVKPLSRKKYIILTGISLGIIIMFSFFASIFNTSGYQVKISHFTLDKAMTEEFNSTPITKDGVEIGGANVIQDPMLKYTVDVYKPNTATKGNPAPVVFVLPGFTRTKETQAQFCIELSRRGFVVFCSDPGQQGGTTASGYETITDEATGKTTQTPYGSTVGNNGLDYLWHYVYNNTAEFNYIDRDRIGATGHSAGGGDVVKAAAKFAGDTYEQSLIKALYCSGYIKNSAANLYQKLRCNAGMSYAYYDEGSFRYQTASTSMEVISLKFINDVNGKNTNTHQQALYETAYGDMFDGTYRIIRNEKTNHCFEVFDKTSVANSIAFFMEALSLGSDNINVGLSPYNQIWWGKEFCTGLALVGAFMLVIALSGLLISCVPFFRTLREPAPQRIAKQNKSDKIIFWSCLLITAIIACLDYIPLAYLSTRWFPDAAGNVFTFFFPARMFNAVLLWATLNGIVGIVIFLLTYFGKHWLYELIKAKRQGVKPVYDFEQLKSLKIKWSNLPKTFLLATILFTAFFLLSQLCVWVFGTDFRFMMISSGAINPRFFVTWLIYIPFMFVYYIANSIRVNLAMTFENWKEWKIMLVGGFANSVGILFTLIINYVAYFTTGTVFYGYYGNPPVEVWLYINMLFPLFVMMFLLPIFNRIFYKQTNRVYLGAITNCMIFVMMSLLGTVSYIPM